MSINFKNQSHQLILPPCARCNEREHISAASIFTRIVCSIKINNKLNTEKQVFILILHHNIIHHKKLTQFRLPEAWRQCFFLQKISNWKMCIHRIATRIRITFFSFAEISVAWIYACVYFDVLWNNIYVFQDRIVNVLMLNGMFIYARVKAQDLH